MTAADRLRHAVAVLQREGSADMLAVADAIGRYLEGAVGGLTLDIALGVSPAPGQTPWWEQEARERRNAALRQLREVHFGDLGITAAARAIEQEARRYQASIYRRSGRREAVGDDRKRLLDEALSTGLGVPKARQIETILRNEI